MNMKHRFSWLTFLECDEVVRAGRMLFLSFLNIGMLGKAPRSVSVASDLSSCHLKFGFEP